VDGGARGHPHGSLLLPGPPLCPAPVKPLLILDTYLEEEGAASPMRALVGDRPTRVVRPPFGDAVPETSTEYAALLLTGSAASATDESLPWIAPLRALVRDAVDRDQPVLGICFGHQVLAQAVLGPEAVRRSETPEFGWREIEVLADHPLMAGIERRFSCFVSHFDEVCVPPGDLEVIARSNRCAIHAFQVPGKPAVGVQFHPEMPPEECERLVRRYLPRIDPDTDPETLLAQAVDQRPLGRELLANFLRWVPR
jgi:GMP synthase (glutamine-hydrolysing)